MINDFLDKYKKLFGNDMERLKKIENRNLEKFIDEFIDLFKPSKIFVLTDSEEDRRFLREMALKEREENLLLNKNHTYHFDNYYDQARDKENTRILTPNGEKLPFINTVKRDEGLREIKEIMRGQMKGRTMIIGFFSLGPLDSPLSLKAVQLTDSFYVAHSETILYRTAYNYFLENENVPFMKFVHSQGELDERMTSKNIPKRRIYFDLEDYTAYSVNTQYAGNTVGLKKPAFRLTIGKALREGWLSEHMFLMGVNGPKGRTTYLTGAFPSMCGKTSTCMIPGEKLVGDDLVFMRINDGKPLAINIENGVFGIIDGINEKDDPIIWNVIHSDEEVIFSNVLVSNGKPYWNGMGEQIPEGGENHSGVWWKGKKDKEGKEIPPSHKNARFTVPLSGFKNLDKGALDSKEGVEIGGIIYGGRDSDTWPPVCEAFNWNHGIINKGASIESETTAASLGKEGVRTFNAMSIMEFLSVDLGSYLKNYVEFGKKLKVHPKIFGVNYFLTDGKKFLNEKTDKAVWLKWIELRIHNEVGAIKTPIGFIPKYENLVKLFREVLNKEYSKDDYEAQFSIRVPKLIEKNERIYRIYKDIKTTPTEVFEELERERERLMDLKKNKGELVSPFYFNDLN